MTVPTAGRDADVPTLPPHVDSNPVLSRWVTVGTDGVIDVQVGKVELGQGIVTALSQVAADGLGVTLDQVRMVPASTDGPDQGLTSGSMSTTHTRPALEVVCANVRRLFLEAAARRWGVDPSAVDVEDGVFSTGSERPGPPGGGAGDGTSPTVPGPLGYGALAGEVDLDVKADATVQLTDLRQKTVGLSVPRLDLRDKLTGRPSFLHDLRWPGLLFGRVVRPPAPGAHLLDVDLTAVESLAVQVVRDGSFLGVVGADEAQVVRAAERLRAASRWDDGEPLSDLSDVDAFLRSGPHEDIPVLDESLDGPEPGPGLTVSATYSKPFIAHASIAPSCAAARWEGDRSLEVWSHSQGIFRLRDTIAHVVGLDPHAVRMQHVPGAGCYGHNPADDVTLDAVLLARAVPGSHVLTQWSREDELVWDPFGSAMTADASAELLPSGTIRRWSYDVWSLGHTSRPNPVGAPRLLAAADLAEPWPRPTAVDPPLAAGGGCTRNAVPLYSVGQRRVVGHLRQGSSVRSSALRALGSYFNVFAIESFVDELALAAGQDALAFRLDRLDDERGRAVLERAAEAAGWGTPVPDGVGRGIGFARYKGFGAYCAVVAEVEAVESVRVRRLTLAADIGEVVNPDGARNQLEGGAVQATSWTLKERVRFDDGRVTSHDWDSYPILRFSEVPEVQVHLVDRGSDPSVGSGEAAQGPTAGAIANAVAAALGVRVRRLPLTPESVVAAIESET